MPYAEMTSTLACPSPLMSYVLSIILTTPLWSPYSSYLDRTVVNSCDVSTSKQTKAVFPLDPCMYVITSSNSSIFLGFPMFDAWSYFSRLEASCVDSTRNVFDDFTGTFVGRKTSVLIFAISTKRTLLLISQCSP